MGVGTCDTADNTIGADGVVYVEGSAENPTISGVLGRVTLGTQEQGEGQVGLELQGMQSVRCEGEVWAKQQGWTPGQRCMNQPKARVWRCRCLQQK